MKVLKERVFRWWDYPVFFALTGLILAALIHFLLYWFSLRHYESSSWVFWPLFLLFAFWASSHFFRWFLMPLMRRPVPIPARPGLKVAVVTSFVPGIEPIEMLEETLKALVRIRYPHDTWVLDEGDDGEVKALCEKLGARHFSRKNMPQYQTSGGTFQSRSKHGNYNSWLHEIGFEGYEYIATFDTDHVPIEAFLDETLGYFQNPEIGYVQAPQVYYNQKASFIARGAAEESYNYYSCLQMSCYAMGFPIVAGCHTTYRTSALREVGGLAAHDGDDLLITLHFRARRWQGVYVPKILAKGLTPVDWTRYLVQQRRWARSVLDIKFRHYPKYARALPLRESILSFLQGFYYIQCLNTLAGLIFMVSFLLTGQAPAILAWSSAPYFGPLIAVFILSDFFRQRFFLDWRREWGFPWRGGVLRVAKWPYFLLALAEVIANRKFPYMSTPKLNSPPKHHLIVIPQLCIAAVVFGVYLWAFWTQGQLDGMLHFWSWLIGLTSLAIAATVLLPQPDPFDPNLLHEAMAPAGKTPQLLGAEAGEPGP